MKEREGKERKKKVQGRKEEKKKEREQGNQEPWSISTISIDLICMYHRSSPKRRQRECDRIHI